MRHEKIYIRYLILPHEMPIVERLPSDTPKPEFRKWTQEDFKWVSERWEELKKKHGGAFIAVYKKEVVDYDRDISALVKRLKNRFENPEIDTLIIYIPPREIKMLK